MNALATAAAAASVQVSTQRGSGASPGVSASEVSVPPLVSRVAAAVPHAAPATSTSTRTRKLDWDKRRDVERRCWTDKMRRQSDRASMYNNLKTPSAFKRVFAEKNLSQALGYMDRTIDWCKSTDGDVLDTVLESARHTILALKHIVVVANEAIKNPEFVSELVDASSATSFSDLIARLARIEILGIEARLCNKPSLSSAFGCSVRELTKALEVQLALIDKLMDAEWDERKRAAGSAAATLVAFEDADSAAVLPGGGGGGERATKMARTEGSGSD